MHSNDGNSERSVIYNFGEYALDPQNRIVRNGEKVIELTPKQFQTLLVLVENHQRILSKHELLNTIWPEQFVEESNVTQNICVLRKQLGDTVHGTKFIETFPGRGYRFSETVEVVDMHQRKADTEVPLVQEIHFNEHGATGGPLSGLHNVPIRNEENRKRHVWKYSLIAIFCIFAISVALLTGFKQWVKAPKPATIPLPPAQLHTLIRMDGAQSEPSWSQDGQRIAFVSFSSDGSESAVYAAGLNDIRPHRIAYGTGEYSSPVWSPDGKSLAYLHIEQNKAELEVLDLEHSVDRKLTALFPHRYQLNYRHLDWSPDGSFLVVDDKGFESDPFSLFLVSAKTGAKIRLTYPDMDIIGDVAPRFSPDGSHIAFIRLQYRMQNDVFEVPVTGGEQRRMTEASSRLGDVDWDSDHSLIFSKESNDAFRFWRLNLQASRPLPELASSLATDMPSQFSISRRTHQAVISAYEPDLNIWSVDLTSRHPSPADWTRIVQTPGQDVSPAFSPDGKRISYRSDVSGRMQLWVCNADGSGAFQIDTGSIIPDVENWAPDSKSIVFSSNGLIYVVNVSSHPGIRQILSPRGSHPAFSGDGKWIFVRKNYFIYRVPASDGNSEQISDQGGAPITPSEDGRYLYFGHSRMDTIITRLDLVTKEQKVIVHSLMPGYRQSWALKEKGILFLTQWRGNPTIAFHDFQTGKEWPMAKFSGALPSFSISSFSVSPDGRRLLLVRADPASANLQTTTF